MLTIGPRAVEPLAVGLWGCGSIGRQIAEKVAVGQGGNVRIVGVLARATSAGLAECAALVDAQPCTSLDALLDLGPKVVLEAASAEGLAEQGPTILESGVDLIALSPSCLFDAAIEARFREAARSSGRTMLIPSASAAGVDHLLANRDDELRSVRLIITWHPNPRAVPYTGQGEVQQVFEGTARQAGRLHPRTLNFVVAIALAGLGLDHTAVRIQLDPNATFTSYRLELDAATTGLQAEVELRRPDGRRGRTAALSALATLRQLSPA
jgi:aspartate dehydrogenase